MLQTHRFIYQSSSSDLLSTPVGFFGFFFGFFAKPAQFHRAPHLFPEAAQPRPGLPGAGVPRPRRCAAFGGVGDEPADLCRQRGVWLGNERQSTASLGKKRSTAKIRCHGKREMAQKESRTKRGLPGLHVLALREQVESQELLGKNRENKR